MYNEYGETALKLYWESKQKRESSGSYEGGRLEDVPDLCDCPDGFADIEMLPAKYTWSKKSSIFTCFKKKSKVLEKHDGRLWESLSKQDQKRRTK